MSEFHLLMTKPSHSKANKGIYYAQIENPAVNQNRSLFAKAINQFEAS